MKALKIPPELQTLSSGQSELAPFIEILGEVDTGLVLADLLLPLGGGVGYTNRINILNLETQQQVCVADYAEQNVRIMGFAAVQPYQYVLEALTDKNQWQLAASITGKISR